MDEFIGIIKIFAGNFAPQGWLICNGQSLQINQYQALYSILGTTYGGNGQTTFNLPDLRSRSPIHFGQGTGLANYNLGAVGGSESVILNSQQMPMHNHSINANSSSATSATPSSTTVLASALDENGGAVNAYSTNSANVQLATTSIGASGGNLAHENRMPFIALNYIICYNGIYPPRD